jgi:hypothetical protein
MPKLPVDEDAALSGLYDENKGFAGRVKQSEQEHQQSGDLSPSSDPVRDGDNGFKIHYPGGK